MTVSTLFNKEIATGNGLATSFPFNFGTLPSPDLVVSLFDLNDVEIPQVEGVDYEITGAGQEDGGAVDFTVAPPANYTVLIQRIIPLTQPTDIKNQGSFYPRTVERSFGDRNVFIAQQQQERIDASMQLPPQVTGVSTVLPVPEATTLVGWNDAASGLQNFPLASIATSFVYGDKVWNTFTGNGVQTVFTVSENPGSIGNLDVSITGVTKVPMSDYTLLSRDVTFTTPPANGAVILIRFDKALPIGAADAASTAYTPPQTGSLSTVRVFLDTLWAAGASSGSALVRFLQIGTGAVARTVQEKLRETISVKDFGATGDGVTVDYAAFGAAINYCLTTGARLRVPAGVYNMGANTIARTLTTRGVLIEGDGVEQTKIVFTGSGDGFNWTLNTSVDPQQASIALGIRDISLETSFAGAGVGWHVQVSDAAPGTGGFDGFNRTVENVRCDSSNGSGWWNYGLRFRNATFSTVENYQFGGVSKQGIGIGYYGTRGGVDNMITNYRGGGCNKAIEHLGAGEGLYVSNFVCVNPHIGIDWDSNTGTGSGKPLLTVVNMHCAFDQFGIRVRDLASLLVTNALLYCDGTGAVGIKMSGSATPAGDAENMLTNVNFVGLQRDVHNPVGIFVEANVRSILVSSCIFTFLNAAVIIGSTGNSRIRIDRSCRYRDCNIQISDPSLAQDESDKQFAKTEIKNLTGGAVSELVDFGIPAGYFNTRPVYASLVQESTGNSVPVIGVYLYDAPETTNTSVRFNVMSLTGANLIAGAYRFGLFASSDTNG